MEETPQVPQDLAEIEQEETVDPSHELDLETVFESQGVEAELEAMGIKSVLEANGIPTVLSGSSSLPNFPFAVQVPREHAESALRLLAEARAAGPAAAEEAERATEVP